MTKLAAIVVAILTLVGVGSSARAWETEFHSRSRRFFTGVQAVGTDSSGNVLVAGARGRALLVAKLASSNGTVLWHRRMGGDAPALAVDDQGNAVVIKNSNGRFGRFFVAKLAAANGKRLWLRRVARKRHASTMGGCVVVDSSGDVVAGGGQFTVANGSTRITESRSIIAKLSGSTGDLLWQYNLEGTGNDRFDGVFGLAVDGSGDIVAAATVVNTGTGTDFAIVKLSGSTGTEIWRHEISLSGPDDARSVALDSSGDVIAAGSLENAAAIVKVSGATGDELWRTEINGTSSGFSDFVKLAVDSNGDAFAIGKLSNSAPSSEGFAVVKVSGTTGAELWRREVTGNAPGYDYAGDLALDPAGNPVAVGRTTDTTNDFNFTVVKLSSATGDPLWQRDLSGTLHSSVLPDYDMGIALTIDGAGDVIAGGTTTDLLGTRRELIQFTTVKLSGDTGADK